jgi:hypothetical protein
MKLVGPSRKYRGRKRILQAPKRETTLTARSGAVRARPETNFRKDERAKEGAKAMMEYQSTAD